MLATGIFGFDLRLNQQLMNDRPLSFNLFAFFLEGLFHVLNSTHVVFWSHFVESCDGLSYLLEVLRALIMLGTARLKVFFNLLWTNFVLVH